MSARARILVPLVLLVGGCPEEESTELPPPTHIKPRKEAPVVQDPPVPVQAPVDLREALARAYRLQPDPRCLTALSDVMALKTGQPRVLATATFEKDHWLIRHGSTDVGTLPGVPSLADCFALLEQVTRVEEAASDKKAKRGLAPTAKGLMPVKDALAAAVASGKAWEAGQHDDGILQTGSHAMVSLVAHLPDTMDAGDAMFARALAVVALARARNPQAVAADEALLASLLGYHDAALQAAALLPKNDPVATYVRQDSKALSKLGNGRKAPYAARYLLARHIRETGRNELKMPTVDAGKRPGLATLSTGLLASDFETRRQLATNGPATLFALVAADVPLPTDGKVLHAYDALLDAREGDAPGAFLAGGLRKTYFQVWMYSALYAGAEFVVEQLSSELAAQQMAERLQDARDSSFADFVRWFEQRAQAKRGKADRGTLLAELGSASRFGVAASFDTFKDLQRTLDWGDPTTVTAVKRLVARMDTRSSHLDALADMAEHGLRDLAMVERLRRTRVARGPQHHARDVGWVAFRDGDRAGMKRALSSDALPLALRRVLVEALVEAKELKPAEAQRHLAAAVQKSGKGWSSWKVLVDFLEARHDEAAALKVVEGWRRQASPRGLEGLAAQTAHARLLQKTGQLREAWSVVEPAIPSRYGAAMIRGSLILSALGRKEEAEKLARDGLARYPDSDQQVANVAEVLWRHDDVKGAAATLAHPPRPLSTTAWRWSVGPVAASVFAQDPERLIRATEALVAEGAAPGNLIQLALAFDDAKLPALAFEVGSRVRVGGMEGLDMAVQAYVPLKKTKGEEAARTWLKSQVPPPLHPPFPMFAFGVGEDTLLWGITAEPSGNTEHDDFAWLMRAAAAARSPALMEKHREELNKHYEGPRRGYYDDLGRFMMGRLEESAVLAHTGNPKRICEVAYYVGLKAHSEGRVRDAVDWYRATVETGARTNGEYRWAHTQLAQWMTSGKSVARLEEELRKPR
ncbi:MAG: hypothetical protein AB2A00_37655 [Myxococcota bacterium]